jgi:hypothetical protein
MTTSSISELISTIKQKGIPETIQLILNKKLKIDITIRELLEIFSQVYKKEV